MEGVSSLRARPRLILADDHVLFADALRAFLEKNHDIVGVVSDGRTLVAEALRLRPDLLVIDIALPSLNGLDAARRIREQDCRMKLLFLTMLEDPNLAAAALMEFGPIGFVLKHSAGRELLSAINQVLNHKQYLSPKLRPVDHVGMELRVKRFEKGLTARQREIVQLLAEGKALKEVADVLELSPKTVEFHKHHIMSAFGLKNNADLVIFALKNRLIWAEF